MGDARRDIVVIGGSAGALEPLKQIVTDLPADLPAAVVVVLHLSATARSALAPILNRAGGLQAVTPRNGDPIRPGYLYTPTPDLHLELHDDGFRVTHGPKVNGARPSIDVLFRSAAATFGNRVVGVVLSGGLDDGSAGLAAICVAGGAAVVQSPDDALIDSMPRNAIAAAGPEHVVPAEKIGGLIADIVGARAVASSAPNRKGGKKLEMEAVGIHDADGQVTGLTCPDCHGSIWMQGDGGELTFNCRIGHSYSPEAFFEIQSENVENALWAGVRSLEEQASMAAVMAARAERKEDDQARRRLERRRELANANADVLRKLILERSDA